MTKTLRELCRLAATMAAAAMLTPVLSVSAEVTYDTRALTGDAAPGTDAVFTHLGVFVLNDAGRIVFSGTIRDRDVPDWKYTKDTGIWSDGSGSLKLVARSGDAAPGTDGVFSDLGGPVLNGAGRTAFFGKIKNGKYGIWSEGSGSLKLIVFDGALAPGADPGMKFIEFGDPVINDAGQTSFWGN